MRPGVERPYSAPTTASASADSRTLITVCSSDRMRSGLASARASPSTPPGSTMWGAVIVMTPFEGAVRGSLEGSRDGRVYVYNHDELGDRATPLCGTQLYRLVTGRPERVSIQFLAAICGIFDCELNDLITYTAATQTKRRAAAGPNVVDLNKTARPRRARIVPDGD